MQKGLYNFTFSSLPIFSVIGVFKKFSYSNRKKNHCRFHFFRWKWWVIDESLLIISDFPCAYYPCVLFCTLFVLSILNWIFLELFFSDLKFFSYSRYKFIVKFLCYRITFCPLCVSSNQSLRELIYINYKLKVFWKKYKKTKQRRICNRDQILPTKPKIFTAWIFT